LQDLLKEVTVQTYVIDWASTFKKAVEKISADSSLYDICIIDYRLGILTGLDLLRFIHEKNPHLPVILFTGQGDSEVDMQAMKSGASDYLVKGNIDSNLLERSIRYSINQAKTQEQLLDQEKNVRESEKFAITGRIALVIAHEVRNPLTSVKLALHQLKDETKEIGQPLADLFAIAERNCDRINHLITNLLVSTKFSELHYEGVAINELLDEAIDLARDRAEMKSITIVRKYSQDLCEVYVDKEKIKIALLNLLVNAIEAVEKNIGVITIITEGKNNKCVVTIRDNGEGIPPEDINRIFEPYFSSKEKGIGLGLTSTQTIIYNHQGTINVESQLSKGTTFVVTFDFKPINR
jgi:signal transduction histidine kinase